MFLEKDEMKFAIIYALKLYGYPLSLKRLTELMTWDEDVMSYFDLAIMLGELNDEGFTERLFYRNEECVKLTQKGEDANEFFSGRVPKAIRKSLDERAASEDFDEKTNPNGTFSDIEPVAKNRYMATLTMLDGGTPILELKIDVGHRSRAESAKDVLKAHADEIYKFLCKTLDENE